MALNDSHYLCMCCDYGFALRCEKRDNGISFSQTTESQFANNKWVAEQSIILDDFFQLLVTVSKMVDPD
jgi:hypothetical protein